MNRFGFLAAAIVIAGTLSAGPAQDAPPMQGMQGMQGMHGMQENMQSMRDLMTQIRATRDPAERKKLMQKHRELMQSQMHSMKTMGPMKGDCAAMNPMMEQMLDQMMQHEDAVESAGDKPVK